MNPQIRSAPQEGQRPTHSLNVGAHEVHPNEQGDAEFGVPEWLSGDPAESMARQ